MKPLTTEEEDFYVMDAIGKINMQISQSYPYKSGTVVLNTRYYTKNVLIGILQHYKNRNSSISINYTKNQVSITDYFGYF